MIYKRGLVFTREVGAIDNLAYRQINGCEGAHARRELRQMRDFELLEQKSSGKATYYKPGQELIKKANVGRQTLLFDDSVSAPVPHVSGLPPYVSAPVPDLIEPPPGLIEPVRETLLNQLPDELKKRLSDIGLRTKDPGLLKNLVLDLCGFRAYRLEELSLLLQRKEKYLLWNFVLPLREEGKLQFTYPEMPNHPNQAYTTIHPRNQMEH